MSDKVTIVIQAELRDAVRKEAYKQGESIRSFVERALTDALPKRGRRAAPARGRAK